MNLVVHHERKRDFDWIMEHHEHNYCVFDKPQVFRLTRRAYTNLTYAEGKHYYIVHFGSNKSSVHLMAVCCSSTAPPHSCPPPNRVSCCQTGPRDFVPVWIPEEFRLPGVIPSILGQCPQSIQSTLGPVGRGQAEDVKLCAKSAGQACRIFFCCSFVLACH